MDSQSKPHVRLAVTNFEFLRQKPPTAFDWLRIDPVDNCNLKCVYCPVPRSDGVIQTEDLQAFFEHNVISIENVQFGCGMEPTIDDRLADLMLMVANSKAKPTKRFVLQTNGLMLHRHDYEKFNAAGLTRLSASMDSMNDESHKIHRGGSSLSKVINNLQKFREACPTVEIQILAVVTKLNIGELDSLVQFAIDLNASSIVFREMAYSPDCLEIEHDRVLPLVLAENEFKQIEIEIRDKYGAAPIYLGFIDRQFQANYRSDHLEESHPGQSSSNSDKPN